MIELLWLAISVLAVLVTLDNAWEANEARRAWSNGVLPPTPQERARKLARLVAAKADLKLQVLLLASSVGCVIIVIPSLGRPGDVPLSPFVVAAMLIPVGLAGASVVRRRARQRVERLLAAAQEGSTA